MPTGPRSNPAADPPPAATTTDPRCGRCGYIVRGIGSLVCPECGADLREVGIDVGKGRGGGPSAAARAAVVILAMAFWTAVGYPVWSEATRRTQAALGRHAVTTWSVTLSRPASKAFGQARIEARSEGPADGPPAASRVTVAVVGDAGTLGEFTADPSTDTYSYTAGGSPGAAGVAPGTAGDRVGPRAGVGQAALAGWLARCTGRPVADVDAEARDLAGYLNAPPAQHRQLIQFGNGGSSSSGSSNDPDGTRQETGNWTGYGDGRRAGFASGGGSYRVFERPPAWFPAAAAAVGLTVWLLGLGWICRRLGVAPRRPRAGPPG